jgi:type II restriction enzyme
MTNIVINESKLEGTQLDSTSKTLKLANGTQIYLAPGKHHELLIAIIEKFSSRFAPGAAVLYVGDVLNKAIIYEKERLEQLGMSITTQDRLPDIILYDETRNLLFLVEAGISHISVTHRRRRELETLLQGCDATRIYVSAFLYQADYGRNASHIAWESHVWIAEMPDHMIHYNGDMAVHG